MADARVELYSVIVKCQESSSELKRLWAGFLEELLPILGIGNFSDPYDLTGKEVSLQQISRLRRRLEEIEHFIYTESARRKERELRNQHEAQVLELQAEIAKLKSAHDQDMRSYGEMLAEAKAGETEEQGDSCKGQVDYVDPGVE